MKFITWFIILTFPNISLSRVDVVDWTVLEENWRKPICLEEAVYPLDAKRAIRLAKEKEQQLKSQHSVRKLESLAYAKEAPLPELLEPLREIIVLKSLSVARTKKPSKSQFRNIKKYARAAYTVCSRILTKHPATRCHDFLLVNIKAKDFVNLIGRHYDTYKASAIYILDMQGQCRAANNPDWNCSDLAQDYFAKNHLESCIAGQLEPPEKLEPLAGLLDEAKANW